MTLWTEKEFDGIFERHARLRRTTTRALLLQVCVEASRALRAANKGRNP